MHRARRQRRVVIYSLIGILILMTAAYAAFSQSIDIKGTTKVTSNWDVKITNVSNGTPTGGAENSKDTNGNTISPTWDKLSASVSADLYEAGDAMEYIVTITNNGTIDATLDDVAFTPSNNSAVIITYSGYAKGQKLYKKGSSNSSVDIKVKVEYNPEYTGGEVTGESSISFNFVQSETKEVTNDTVISNDSYKLTYNCTENGGTGSQEAMFDVGANVDLSVKCKKTGYEFLGWNTNKNATSAINNYTMPSSNSTLYAIYEALDTTPPVIDSFSTTNTATTIIAIVASHDDETGITKYEFSKDGGSTWVDNGTNGTYTFNNLTMGQTYPVKVRVTNGADGKTTSDTIEVTPNLPRATFTEYITGSITNVEITYPEECSNGTYTCSYIKNSESEVTVDSNNLTNNKIDVPFTESGTLIAKVSDGTNTVSSTYTVTYIAGDNATGEETYSAPGATTFTVPATGEYFLQVWGAQGGSYDSSFVEGGKGGYSYGTITLNKDDVLYINTGGQGASGTETDYTTVSGGGTNGGGAAGYRGGTGGGASDIRVNSDSLYARVIVAGGGGGAYSYSSSYKAAGGYGGGEIAGDGASYSSSYSAFTGKGGTQTAGGAGGTSIADYHGNAGTFGAGGNTGYKRNSTSYYSNGAGGAGWYGGGAAANYNGTSRTRAAGGGGGSGYVYTSSTAENYPSGCLLTSDYYLKDARTIAGDGVESFESPSGGTEEGHSGNGYVKITYEIPTTVNDKFTLEVDNVTTNSVTVVATPKSGLTVTKYEFSSDNGSTWTSNGTSGTYTFTGLTHNTTYNLKARMTTPDGKVVNTIKVKTKELMTPTFSDTNASNSVDSTITYMSGCGSTYTCTYRKNNGSIVTVSDDIETVNFTSMGTLSAAISDGTNTVIDTHDVKETVTLSFTTSKTTNSITVTDTANAPTGVAKYEFQVDEGDWIESANNVYTFTGLSNSTSHTVNSRITTNFGTVKTGISSTVTLNSITLPTYEVENHAVDDVDVTITYPSGCGSTYTCTYTKNSETPVTVTSTTAVVNYSADGELVASVSDGTNTVSSSFTVTMPIDVVDDYGVDMLVIEAGDGLYQNAEDSDDTAYIYRGNNPSNYIKLDDIDVYRILSIDKSGNLKVIRTDSNGEYLSWDPGYSSDISDITSSSSTEGTRYSSNSSDYCYSSSESSYKGCTSWGSKTSTLNSIGTSVVTQMPREAGSTELKNLPTYDSYVNVYLNGGTYPTTNGTISLTPWYRDKVDLGVQKNMITHLWNVGPVEESPIVTLSENIQQETAYKWRGKVGLITPTEYVRATTYPECKTVYDYYGNSSCYSNEDNWLGIYHKLMSPYSSTTWDEVWMLQGHLTTEEPQKISNIFPVFYLSSDIKLKGKGTENEPYFIYEESTAEAKTTLAKLGQIAKEVDSNSGDGIYEDNEGGYIFRGESPNNYIELGTDLYRIMGIDSSGNLKVIKEIPLPNMVWDSGSMQFAGEILPFSDAGTRSSGDSSDYCWYDGCNIWGSKTSTLDSSGIESTSQMLDKNDNILKNLPEYDAYINVYLNGGIYPTTSGVTTLSSWYSNNVDIKIQSKMIDHLWNVGAMSTSGYELYSHVKEAYAYKWRGKVGLMTGADYIRASTDSSCNIIDRSTYYTCIRNNISNQNWLNNGTQQWTMTPTIGDSLNEKVIGINNELDFASVRYPYYSVRPTFYLTSNITLSGSGTSGNPYQIITD